MSDVLSSALAVYRDRQAIDLGCSPGAFDSHTLTVAQRPAWMPQRVLVLGATFGTGTVLSVQEQFVPFVQSLTVEKHYEAFGVREMIEPVLNEAHARGIDVETRGPGLGFLPGERPAAPDLPAGLRLERWELERVTPWAPTFSNALWDNTDEHLDEFRYALVLVDSAGAPQAMAGAWHEAEGLVEIGVDVARESRGRGLAPIVVRSLSRSIFESGSVPTYYCAATNVRSHRTALASGFVPVVSRVSVRVTAAKPAARRPAANGRDDRFSSR